MMQLVVIGLSHKTAPLELREKLAVSGDRISEVLAQLLRNEDISEGMLISTCNRVEAYVMAKHVQKAADAVTNLFAGISGVQAGELSSHLYVRNTGDAIAHLFRVASSLDSMVVGETQISGQVKEAYARAVAIRATGVYLNKIVPKALNVSKRIRTETAVGQQSVSISYAAVLLAERIFGDLSGTRVLLLGAGEMGSLAAKHLRERKVGEIRIANRTRSKAEDLAKELGGSAVDFESFRERLDEADIVIASTGAEGYVVSLEDVRGAMHRRKNRPMFFIDIAVPRNVDPAVNQLENVYLYDIDHLQGVVEANMKEREKEARRAEGIIQNELEKFHEVLNHIELSPTIEQLSKKLDQIRKAEIDKMISKNPDLPAGQREALEACTRAIVNKILHDPIIQMKTEEPKEGSPKYSEILKKLFKLDSES